MYHEGFSESRKIYVRFYLRALRIILSDGSLLLWIVVDVFFS